MSISGTLSNHEFMKSRRIGKCAWSCLLIVREQPKLSDLHLYHLKYRMVLSALAYLPLFQVFDVVKNKGSIYEIYYSTLRNSYY